MALFDTHAHLDDERFRNDLPAVVDRSTAAGVSHVICVATTAADSSRCVEIAGRFSTVWASVGIQPNNVAEATPDDWPAIERLVTGTAWSLSAKLAWIGIGTLRHSRSKKIISPGILR